MSLRQCSESKQVFNTLVKLEQNLTIERSLSDGKLMIYEGKKLDLIREIIRVLEFFLKVTGKEMEDFQIQILAGFPYQYARIFPLNGTSRQGVSVVYF